jgi:hypothetical protein
VVSLTFTGVPLVSGLQKLVLALSAAFLGAGFAAAALGAALGVAGAFVCPDALATINMATVATEV